MDSGERVGREERGSRTQSRSYPWPVGQEKPQGRGGSQKGPPGRGCCEEEGVVPMSNGLLVEAEAFFLPALCPSTHWCPSMH